MPFDRGIASDQMHKSNPSEIHSRKMNFFDKLDNDVITQQFRSLFFLSQLCHKFDIILRSPSMSHGTLTFYFTGLSLYAAV